MSKNEVAVLESLNEISTQVGTDKQFEENSGPQYLGRLHLYSKGRAIDTKQIPGGHFGIPGKGNKIIDLGETVDLIPLAKRLKALDTSDDEAIVVNYDPESEEYLRIKDLHDNTKDSGCMHGPSFLVYERSTGKFLEFYCGTKSTRNEADAIAGFLPLTAADIKNKGLKDETPRGPSPLRLTAEVAKKGKWTWHVPVVSKCSTPIPLPAIEKVIAEIKKFIACDDGGGAEKVEETAAKKGRAR